MKLSLGLTIVAEPSPAIGSVTAPILLDVVPEVVHARADLGSQPGRPVGSPAAQTSRDWFVRCYYFSRFRGGGGRFG